MRTRSNQEWLSALGSPGPEQAAALADLRNYVQGASLFTLNRSRQDLAHLGPDGIGQLAEDCAQDALVAILDRLADFRGESKFTTWAYKFAVNIALTAARREGWRNVSLDQVVDGDDEPELSLPNADSRADPDRVAAQNEAWSALREVILHDLSPRQRQVLIAMVFKEVPMDEVARHLHSNRNAIYKLLHDARRKLRDALLARGFAVSETLALFAANEVRYAAGTTLITGDSHESRAL